MEKPAPVRERAKLLQALFLETQVGKVGGHGLLGFTSSTATGEIFGKVLAHRRRIPNTNHSKDCCDLTRAFAFGAHGVGNFGRANLSCFLRRAE